MSYLLIENPGEAPLDGLLLWGATSRDNSDETCIGQFGSGTKFSVLTCIRKGIYPKIFTGKQSLEWSLNSIKVADVDHKEVMVSVNNKAPKSTGATLGMGRIDWADRVDLALREFVSNALDAVGGQRYHIQVRVVEDNQVRARAGYTRVFVPWSPNPKGDRLKESFLSRWFLHFREGGQPHIAGPLPKSSPGRAQFYRRGVLIRQWSQEGNSLYDYNFIHLTLDEARTADDWKLQYEAAKLLTQHPEKFARTLKAVGQDSGLWEAGFSSYGLGIAEEKKAEILLAVKSQFGGNVVLTESSAGMNLARNKGREAVLLPQAWVNAVDEVEGPTLTRELGQEAGKGIDLTETQPAFIASVLSWIGEIEAANLTGGKERPDIFSFDLHPGAERKMLGYCDPGKGIFLNNELGGELLEQTVIEELAHWYSGSSDFTREFQEWVFRLVVRRLGKEERMVA